MCIETWYQKLSSPTCFPKCIGEICGGWTQETLKQAIVKLTKNGKAPIQLWFSNAEEMEPISKKINVRKEIFDLFDNKNGSRIDTMDMLSIIQLACASKLDMTIMNMMKYFGFVPKIFTRDEFHFYLDSLFAGVIITGVLQGHKAPLKEMRDKRVQTEDIEAFVTDIFDQEELLERELFAQKFMEHKELGPLYKYFQEGYSESSKYSKKYAMELVGVNQQVRRWIYEWISNAVS